MTYPTKADDGKWRSSKSKAATLCANSQANNEATEQRKRRLLDQVFGNPSTLPSQVIAQRDALDRAAKIKTAEEAASALKLARFTGDHGLAKAIAMRAYDFATGPDTISSEWVAVINAWAENEAPGVDDALTELSEINRENLNWSTRLNRGMQFSVSEPTELKGKNAEHLAMHADADDQADELPNAG